MVLYMYATQVEQDDDARIGPISCFAVKSDKAA